MRRDPRPYGDIGELAITIVVIEAVGEGLIESRMTVGANALGGIAAEPFGGGIPLHVVHAEEIEAATIVEAQPCRRDGPLTALQAVRAGYILEGAVAPVVEQRITFDARH